MNPIEANKKIMEILDLTGKPIQSIKIEFTPETWPTITITMLPKCNVAGKILTFIEELQSCQE